MSESEKEGGERRKGRGGGRGKREEGGEKIMMTMMDVMMTIKVMVAMVLMIKCDVDDIDDGGDGGNNTEYDYDDDKSSNGKHIGGHLHAKFVLPVDITVHLSSFPFKTTLCRMLGLIGLVAFAEIHFTGFIGFGKYRQH